MCVHFKLNSLAVSGPTGPVTEVKTDIYVTSFGPVSDVEMVGTRSRGYGKVSLGKGMFLNPPVSVGNGCRPVLHF